MKFNLSRIYWIIKSQFGIDPKRSVRAIRSLPRFFRDLKKFRSTYFGSLEYLPCLHDWQEEAGNIRSEYFWQDLLVARMVKEADPVLHVDVGSRLDGFVAHVASFRQLEVFDVRPMSIEIPGVTFVQANLMEDTDLSTEYCDSLSCLHALEHFGLGRYGDPINAEGFELGLKCMTKLLKSGGTFYLSVPIGIERVEFNGQRVSDPQNVLALCRRNGLVWSSLTTIAQNGEIHRQEKTQPSLRSLADKRYSLGIFVFSKEVEKATSLARGS